MCRDVKEFTAQQGRGKFQVSPTLIHQAIHSDGSILIACEAEFIPPGCKMIAEEVKPNTSLLDDEELDTLNLSDAMADMFENELHADCSFKVRFRYLRLPLSFLHLPCVAGWRQDYHGAQMHPLSAFSRLSCDVLYGSGS